MSINRNRDEDREATLQAVQARQLPVTDGHINWLGHRLRSGAAQIDEILLTGATIDEMGEARGAVYEHLRHLQEAHGLALVEENGGWRFDCDNLPEG